MPTKTCGALSARPATPCCDPESPVKHRARVHCAPDITERVLIMELIITSFIAAVLLLVGHLGVLVRNRLWAQDPQREPRS